MTPVTGLFTAAGLAGLAGAAFFLYSLALVWLPRRQSGALWTFALVLFVACLASAAASAVLLGLGGRAEPWLRLEQLALGFTPLFLPWIVQDFFGDDGLVRRWSPLFFGLSLAAGLTFLLASLFLPSSDLFESRILWEPSRGWHPSLLAVLRDGLLTFLAGVYAAVCTGLFRRKKASEDQVLILALQLGFAFLFLNGLNSLPPLRWMPSLLPGLTAFVLAAMGGRVLRYVRQTRDLEEIRRQAQRSQEELIYQATHDLLTQLPNRRSFQIRLEELLALSNRTGETRALLLLDLDNFGALNRSAGPALGDLVLARAAERLRTALRQTDHAFRLGGDEFAVLLSPIRQALDAAFVAQKLLAAFGQALDIEGQNITVSLSLGLVLFPRDGLSVTELLRKADGALQEAKKDRNSYRFFSEAYNRESAGTLRILADLRRALSENRLELHYQPVLDQQDRVCGAEALMRWQPAQGPAISPAVFIPLAETAGLMRSLGAWALKRAFWDVLRLREAGFHLYISVNLSPRQLRDPGLLDLLDYCLGLAGIQPGDIRLELTESALLDKSPEGLRVLQGLVQRGIPLMLDDFGTGGSSLSALKNLPLQTLKIDRSFLEGVPGIEKSEDLVRALLNLARSLGMEALAEGVERAEQKEFLALEGCLQMQGFLFSPARPFGELLAWLSLPRPLDSEAPQFYT